MGLFRVSGWFVNHEFKHSGQVEIAVERDLAPSPQEAEPLLWPLSDAQLERLYPGANDGFLRNEFTSVTVRDQPRIGISGATSALGGLVTQRIAHLAPRAVADVGALHGVDVLCMVSDGSLIRAAVDAGVQHILALSFCGAADAAEQAIRESGVAFTILRTNVVVNDLVEDADAAGVIRGPAGDGRAATVARADVADIAATVLDDPDRHVGATYTLSGSEALTLTEIAARASAVLGRSLTYEDAPAPQDALFAAIADGSCAEVTGDIAAVRRWRPRTLEEALK